LTDVSRATCVAAAINMTAPDDNALTDALRAFEAAEANVVRLETLWSAIEEEFPTGAMFQAASPQYEDRCRAYIAILDALPSIDSWKPSETPLSLSDVNHLTIGAHEVGDVEAHMSVHDQLSAPGRELREYRFRLNRQRRQLVRDVIADRIATIDAAILRLQRVIPQEPVSNELVTASDFENIRDSVDAIETLLGSSIKRPNRWSDLRRHLRFGQIGDLIDIVNFDWPAVRGGLQTDLYAPDEPIPVGVADLATLARSRPKGKVPARLKWEHLAAEDFERLIFALINMATGYENPQWLMRTNAPDRGRDLSVTRVNGDSLAGTTRMRVIIQCRHGLTQSISPIEVTTLRDQMALWEPPRIDVLVIATTGRFTSDAVALIEKHNQSDRALRIEMWPESHLEGLLAERPAAIAEFGLR
jgi:hypothetical protein